MKQSLAVALLLAGVLGAIASAHADPRARFIASNCAYCHGPDGKSQGAIPSLAGLEPAYFVAQMKAFKDGSRPGTVMQKHANGYTDAEYEALAKHFAAPQAAQPAAAPATAAAAPFQTASNASGMPAECVKLAAALKGCDHTSFLASTCKSIAKNQFDCPLPIELIIR